MVAYRKRQMTTVSSIRLTICMLVLLLCISGQVKGQQRELEVTTFLAETADWYTYEAARFMKEHPDIKIKVQLVPGGIDGFRDYLNVRVVSGDPPDIADTILRYYHPWADYGMLVDQLPLLQQSQKVPINDIVPGLVQTKMYNGGLYNAPTTVDPSIVIFNSRLFSEAGLLNPYELYQKVQWSWDSALTVAQKLTRRDGNQTTQWGWRFGTTDWLFGAFIYANGGRILSPDMTRPMFQEQAGVEALNWMASMMRDNQVAASGWIYTKPYPAVAPGVIFHAARRYNETPDETLGVAVIPPPKGGAATMTSAFADGPIIFKKGGNEDAAWLFVEWMLTKEAQQSLADITGRLPGRMASMSYWAQATAPYIGGSDKASVFVEATFRLLPLGPHYADMWAVLQPALVSAQRGEKPAEVILSDTARRVQAILDEYSSK
jgi:ABC-type glycerol-3-phosphate transport system substrate-binding protein